MGSMATASDRVRIGIIGAGGMGTFHAHTLHALPGTEVTVIADPFSDDAEALAAQLGATFSRDVDSVASAANVDAVVIASPDETHAELALAALAAGKPMLCEKPLATSIADAQRVVDAEAASGRRSIQLGFMREYDEAHVQLAKALTELGAVHFLRCAHRNTASAAARPVEVIVGQSVVHDIHSVRFLSASEIFSVTANAAYDKGVLRHLVVLCRLVSGAHAVLEFDDAAYAYDVTVEATAADGDVLTGDPLRATLRQAGDRRVAVGADWFGRFADAYRHQDQAWVNSIRSGVFSGPSAWDGLVAQVVVEAILASLADGEEAVVRSLERPVLYAT